jgi:hypothetical protein
MTSPRLLLVSATAAGLGGFALGWLGGSPPERIKNADSPSSETHLLPGVARTTTPIPRVPALAAGKAGMDQLLAVLQSGSRPELLESLRQVVANRTLPPFLADLYRDAFAERLAKMGAAEELLAPGAFPEKDQAPIAAAVVRALVDTNRAKAEKLIDGLPPGTARQSATAAFLLELGEHDPAAGLAWIDAHPQSRESAGALFRGWVKVAPEAAAAAAFAKGRDLGSARTSVIYAWATEDPDAALKWLDGLPLTERRPVLEPYLQSLIMKDPGRALDALARPEFNESFMGQWIGLVIATDAASATAAVDRLPPGRGRSAVIRGIASSLSGDPEMALAWANTLLPGERDAAVRDLFETLGRDDPEAALGLASAKLDGPARKMALASIIGGWAETDFDAAFSGMIAKLDPATLREALPAVFRYHSFTSEQDYIDQATKIGTLDPKTQVDAWRELGKSEGMRTYEKTFGFLSQLTPSNREAFTDGLMESSFELTPKTFDQLSEILSPDQRSKWAQKIARSFATTDPRKAANFLLSLPESGPAGSTKGPATQDLVRQWAYTEPASAQAFVAALAAGDTRDRAAGALARELRYFDLDRATQVAAQVAGQKARSALIGDLANAWAQTNPERGRALLQPLLQSPEDQTRAAVLFDSP